MLKAQEKNVPANRIGSRTLMVDVINCMLFPSLLLRKAR